MARPCCAPTRRSAGWSSATASRRPRSATTLTELKARRAILVSEPGAWDAFGLGIATALRVAGWTVETILLPQGEDAKRLSVVEGAARDLVRLRVERSEPLVAIGGGALGDAAGFLAATYLRGVPLIHVPTTLVAQIDSSIGGKTGVDLPEGKNLVGAFHLPVATIVDVAALRDAARATPASGPRRGGQDGRAGRRAPVRTARVGRGGGAPAGRARRDRGCRRRDRRALRLGQGGGRAGRRARARPVRRPDHPEPRPLGRARGRGDGRIQRAAPRGGGRVRPSGGVRDRDRGRRDASPTGRTGSPASWTRLGLATTPLPYSLETVLDHLASDKKHAAGALRWVLPTEDGVLVRAGIEPAVVERAVSGILAVAAPR